MKKLKLNKTIVSNLSKIENMNNVKGGGITLQTLHGYRCSMPCELQSLPFAKTGCETYALETCWPD